MTGFQNLPAKPNWGLTYQEMIVTAVLIYGTGKNTGRETEIR